MTKFWLVPALLLWGGCTVFGFSLGGPIANRTDSYQTVTLGYALGPPTFGSDVVAPKNLAEEYRWNTKNVYYAYDDNFLRYFGSNGAAQIDAAFTILNSLSNVDVYSPALSEWPLQSARINYPAAQVGLLDLKSFALVLMMEQLGLAEPDRYAYCLRDRITAGAMCPNYTYHVIERNYDPVAQVYSTYVNGVLYTFQIIETCPFTPNPDAPMIADAATVVVDPEQLADSQSAVAAGLLNGYTSVVGGVGPTLAGRYFVGLTRDDVGGLRYLWSSNTINTEFVEPGSLLVSTPPQPSVIVTSNLAQLKSDALTNNLTALQALYPTLQITSNSPAGFVSVPVTNFVLVTNQPPPGSVAGTPPTIVLVPVVTSFPVQTYVYTFGNVITNFTYTNGGVLVTNSPSEYLLIPSNQCGFNIVSNALTFVLSSTNTNGFVSSFTAHALIVNIFTCTPNSVGLREGIGKMNFLRVDYDSLVGTNWGPVSNSYALTAITNNHTVTQTFSRVVNAPDILFTAGELDDNVANRTTPNWNQNAIVSPQVAGPGTISPQVQITFSKVGPIFTVVPPAFLVPIGAGNTNIPDFQWASFDGTTNAPVVYPVNNAYQNLVNNIFLQITTPGSLPSGNVNHAYSVPLTVSGSTPAPYIFNTTSGSMPPGLSVVTVGQTYSIAGTPTATGIFDFTLSVTDTSVPARTSYRNFAIEIDN